MTDMVNSPPHYVGHPSGVQCIELAEWLGFNLGNAFKYCWRCEEKGARTQDLAKAIWYLDRAIEHPRSLPRRPTPSPVVDAYHRWCNAADRGPLFRAMVHIWICQYACTDGHTEGILTEARALITEAMEASQ